MQNIRDYMLNTRDERKKHLKLDEPCDERGLRYSYNMIGLLAWKLDTTIPQRGDNAVVCHGCNNAKCSNPHHLYWGSYKDNHIDQLEAGTFQSVYERSIEKYGEEYKNIIKRNGQKGGHGNAGTIKTEEHRQKIAASLNGRKRGPYKKSTS
jgi:hypothetical protein